MTHVDFDDCHFTGVIPVGAIHLRPIGDEPPFSRPNAGIVPTDLPDDEEEDD